MSRCGNFLIFRRKFAEKIFFEAFRLPELAKLTARLQKEKYISDAELEIQRERLTPFAASQRHSGHRSGPEWSKARYLSFTK